MKESGFKMKGMTWKTGQSPIKNIETLRSKYSAKQYVINPSKKGLIEAASQFTTPPEDPGIERFFGEEYEYSASESELIKSKKEKKKKDKDDLPEVKDIKKKKYRFKWNIGKWLRRAFRKRRKFGTTVGRPSKGKILKD